MKNYFESAPDLQAAVGNVFSANKDTSGINFKQEMAASLNVAEQTGKEMSHMREFADQMRQRAAAEGGQLQNNGSKAGSMIMGEGMSYGLTALAAAINPALGAGMAVASGLKTMHMIQSKMSQNSYFTAPEEIGKGSKADAKSEVSSYESDGGSKTSFQSLARDAFQVGAPSPMMPGQDKPEYTRPHYASEAEYDQIYDDMKAKGLSADDMLEMSMNFDQSPEYLAMMRQYQQHAELRPQNLQMAASAPRLGLA